MSTAAAPVDPAPEPDSKAIRAFVDRLSYNGLRELKRCIDDRWLVLRWIRLKSKYPIGTRLRAVTHVVNADGSIHTPGVVIGHDEECRAFRIRPDRGDKDIFSDDVLDESSAKSN